MMGIWNDMWDRFCYIVSEHIEYIAKDEADLHGKEVELLQKLQDLRLSRDAWKKTAEGKSLQSSNDKRTQITSTSPSHNGYLE